MPASELACAPPSLAVPFATLIVTTPTIASAIDTSARPFGFSRRKSHANSATTAGIVLVMTPAATALVRCTPLSISSVNMNVPKNACRNRFSHSPRLTARIFTGLKSGQSTAFAMTKRSVARMTTGTKATIDLPMPTLLPTSNIDAMRKKA
ncbi:Uncharacterised protein [Burkholderia pseudomallei]|nr:Uncharacterised protein [Burkholderia pseudomallei]CAJ8038226.1 Uncharacterised protein [Burkholderia pseudomallei]